MGKNLTSKILYLKTKGPFSLHRELLPHSYSLIIHIPWTE